MIMVYHKAEGWSSNPLFDMEYNTVNMHLKIKESFFQKHVISQKIHNLCSPCIFHQILDLVHQS